MIVILVLSEEDEFWQFKLCYEMTLGFFGKYVFYKYKNFKTGHGKNFKKIYILTEKSFIDFIKFNSDVIINHLVTH